MDVIASLPGCEGQAADAISAGTPIKMDIAPRLLRNPKSECPDIWTQSWSNIEDPVVLFERNLYGHPLKGLFRKDSSRKFCWSLDGKKYGIDIAYLFIENKNYSSWFTWMTPT